jgi:hypothetical protein
MLVDFMMIGAQKSGTTGLAAQLTTHAKICFSRIKEPGFFNEVSVWQDKIDEYHQLFEPESGQLCGEASTMYTFLPEWLDTHSRLYEYNPDLKLIYIMRQPVNRIISHYTHNLVRGIVTEPPEQVVFADPTYINHSRYAVQIRPYIELFGSENVLLLLFEEYAKTPEITLEKVAAFLNIENQFSAAGESAKHQSTGRAYLKYEAVRNFIGSDAFQAVREYIPMSIRQPLKKRMSNQIESKPEFSAELKCALWRFVEDDVAEIEQMLGHQILEWKKGI